MPSLTEVANMALAMVGDERIVSLATDESKAARLCNEFLAQVRDRCLVLHPWHFAKRQATLPALATAPRFGWTTAIQVPADCMRVLKLDSADPHEPWQRAGNAIWCNLAAPVGMLYVARITDAGAWAPLFVDLVATELAQRLVLPLSASKENRAGIKADLDRLRAEAKAVNASEGTPDPQYGPAELFIQARY